MLYATDLFYRRSKSDQVVGTQTRPREAWQTRFNDYADWDLRRCPYSHALGCNARSDHHSEALVLRGVSLDEPPEALPVMRRCVPRAPGDLSRRLSARGMPPRVPALPNAASSPCSSLRIAAPSRWASSDIPSNSRRTALSWSGLRWNCPASAASRIWRGPG